MAISVPWCAKANNYPNSPTNNEPRKELIAF